VLRIPIDIQDGKVNVRRLASRCRESDSPWPSRMRIPPFRIELVESMTPRRHGHTRTWILGGAALLIATGVAMVMWRYDGGSRSREHVSGWPSLSIASSAGADEPQALLSRARSAVGADRFDEAFEIYRRLDAGRWHADDCFGLGSALLKADRIVLGWAALEAARRIDPKHAEAARALGGIRGKFASATGQERDRLYDAAGRVEFLSAIRGGPPLGLLALGLARFARDSDQLEEFLDRLGARDRAALRGVNSVMTATDLVARLLLETGRAPEAYDLLDSLVSSRGDHDGVAPGAAIEDCEAAWLFSRAALQLDRHETADRMLALAGDFGKRAGSSPEPSPYVGAKRCGDCHKKIYNEQQRESRHAQTLRFGAGLKDVPLPPRPVPDPVIPTITHGFSRRGDDRIEVEARAGDQVIRAVVDYAVGSGRHGITMVAKDTQGIERKLRVSYFAENQSWGETKGINAAPRDAGEHIGVSLTTRSLHSCIQCHATWFRSVDQSRSGPRGPEGHDLGIGCERCHGPGLSHVKAALSGYAEPAIALTSKTPSLARLKSCVECHAADGTVQPSDPEFTRAQGTTFLFSRCFTASKDRFGCTTCHDPHRSVETSVSHYEAKCLSCHQATRARPGDPSSRKDDHGNGQAVASSCPVNATANCISCHMPRVEDPSRRSRFTDHHIRVHRAAAPASTKKGSGTFLKGS
jgi:hypothetical protein